MATSQTLPIAWADDETLRLVRPQVRTLLENSSGFRALPPDEQRQLARTMVKVCSYMVNPQGLASQELSPKNGGVLALANEDPVDATKRRLSGPPGSTGADFQAGAVRQGVEQFGALVQKVDFPNFVSGLIQGVFKAIVDSSIQQMQAYGELLANVAKTVDQFAQDNISKNNARDWLSQKYPGQIDIDTQSADTGFAEGAATPAATPKLVAQGDNTEELLQRISADLQLAKPVTDVSDPNEEERLVLGAQLQMARGRQQLLASMVLLGINRIVVTDGLIHAKVVFDMRASDTAGRKARASMYDRREDKSASQMSASYGGWFSPINADVSSQSSSDHVATVESSVDDTSESKAQVKANLTGEVRVNFKSDYLPMEKMANPQMIAAIQGNAVPPEPPKPAAAPAAKA
jgi:hypothetical protein